MFIVLKLEINILLSETVTLLFAGRNTTSMVNITETIDDSSSSVQITFYHVFQVRFKRITQLLMYNTICMFHCNVKSIDNKSVVLKMTYE